jgi:hypothetical protein
VTPERFVPRERLAQASKNAPRVDAERFRKDMDDAVVAAATPLTGSRTERQQLLRSARGKLRWSGNLASMRRD